MWVIRHNELQDMGHMSTLYYLKINIRPIKVGLSGHIVRHNDRKI